MEWATFWGALGAVGSIAGAFVTYKTGHHRGAKGILKSLEDQIVTDDTQGKIAYLEIEKKITDDKQKAVKFLTLTFFATGILSIAIVLLETSFPMIPEPDRTKFRIAFAGVGGELSGLCVIWFAILDIKLAKHSKKCHQLVATLKAQRAVPPPAHTPQQVRAPLARIVNTILAGKSLEPERETRTRAQGHLHTRGNLSTFK